MPQNSFEENLNQNINKREVSSGAVLNSNEENNENKESADQVLESLEPMLADIEKHRGCYRIAGTRGHKKF